MHGEDSSRRRLRSAPAYERRYGYSRGVAEDPFIFISGTTALDPVTLTVAGDTAQQTRRAWDNIIAALGQVESGPAEIVRVSCMVIDPADAPIVLALSREALMRGRALETTPAELPAMTLVSITQLFNPRMRVAIEVTALWRGYTLRRQ